MYKFGLKNSLEPDGLIKVLMYKYNDVKNHPTFFRVFGTCVFCGAQGEGKTLSAVQYILKICKKYPRAILVSNVAIKDRPFNAEMVRDSKGYFVLRSLTTGKYINTDTILLDSTLHPDTFEPVTVEYTGLDMLKYINNNEFGVLFFIDEIHLELNSLESKNVDIEVMVEISQQRKQRKHIVGTSQVFMRMAKPLREQIHDIIICKNFFGCIQFNKWINGLTATEKNGKLEAEVKGRYIWPHRPEYYEQYDTYVKMRRYNKEWNGRKRIDIYDKEVQYAEFNR
ncbi:MAG: hypothetical protein ACI4IR_04390 [Eubacterium sp.]